MTANQIIGRALRLLKVIAAGETIEAGIAADSLEVLNNMGQRMLADGLLAAWTDAASVASVLTPPAAQSEALTSNLAVLLAPEFEMEPPASVVAMAAQGRQELWRDRLVQDAGTTANTLILRALRLMATAGKLPDSVDFDGALKTLNAMLAEWAAVGFGFTAPAYATTASLIVLTADDHDAVSANLAVRLAPEYAIDPAPIAGGAASLLAQLHARYNVPGY